MLKKVSSTQSILVIEDDPFMRQLIAMHLRIAGYSQVRVAEDAVTGGRMFLESLPDLLLVDIVMPHLDGLALLEAMRGDLRARNVATIVISHRHDDAALHKAKQLGVCAYLHKPLKSEELLSTVNRVLSDPTPM